MLLGHIVEDAATGIWMERPHPTDGMLEADSSWAPGHAGERMAIDCLIRLPLVTNTDATDCDQILAQAKEAWDNCLWKADGRMFLNSSVKN